MIIRRDIHLNRLKNRMHNGMIKVITGIRGSGKSFLLRTLFREYLLCSGVSGDHIVSVDLEAPGNSALRDPDALLRYIDSHMKPRGMNYILLDGIQLVPEFEDVLNSYAGKPNADVYVTGRSARRLSWNVITEFRGRGDEIRVAPLSFSEFCSVRDGSRDELLREYMTYGGLPEAVLKKDAGEKEEFLKDFAGTFLRDIRERYGIRKEGALEELINVLARSSGSLTNPRRLADALRREGRGAITEDTVKSYLDILQDSFLIEKSRRYDIKGRHCLGTPSKYYFSDTGLCSARLGFSHAEFPRLMRNVICNELRLRGFSVDAGEVGFTETGDNGRRRRSSLEVDFVCNQVCRRYYIQSAYLLQDREMAQESRALLKVRDGFRKIIISGSPTPMYQNDDGIVIMNIWDFLMNPESLSL